MSTGQKLGQVLHEKLVQETRTLRHLIYKYHTVGAALQPQTFSCRCICMLTRCSAPPLTHFISTIYTSEKLNPARRITLLHSRFSCQLGSDASARFWLTYL